MELIAKKEPKDNKMIIIGLLCIIVVLLIVVTLFVSGVLTTQEELELERYDFENFTMLVPKGSEFKLSDTVGEGTNYWAIIYKNNLEENNELFMVSVSNYKATSTYANDFIGQDGDLEVYEPTFNGTYMIHRYVDGYYIKIFNFDGDLDNLKEMARSIEITNPQTTQIPW